MFTIYSDGDDAFGKWWCPAWGYSNITEDGCALHNIKAISHQQELLIWSSDLKRYPVNKNFQYNWVS